MAIGNALALIVAGGVAMGAVTSQVVPTQMVGHSQRPWSSPSPEAYPEIVAVNYDNGGGAYYAPRAYAAVEPIMRHDDLDRYDDLPPDMGYQHVEEHFIEDEAITLPADESQNAAILVLETEADAAQVTVNLAELAI